MDKEQISHDLAIAKLYGSDLPTDKLIEQYRQYYNDILSVLKSETSKSKTATVIQSFV